MSLVLTDGMTASVANTYGTANNTTAVSNAASAVFSQSGGHGLVVGDTVEITSPGWPGISGRLARVSVVATNDITLEGINTTNTTKYPAGGAASGGSLRKVSAWTTMAQLTELDPSGDEAKYFTYQFLDQLRERNLPVGKTPLVLAFTKLDDPALADLAVLQAAEESGQPRAFRLVYRGGSGATPPRSLINGYVTVGSMSIPQKGGANIRRLAIAVDADPTEYAT